MKAGMAATQQLDRAPRALRESLLFPYLEGGQWTQELYKRDGWAGVSGAFTNLPKSTEQIMHADKFFAHEAPVSVTLPDVKTILGVGWKRVDYDVNGEWSYYLILDEFLKSSAESKRAAAGWSGDRYEVFEGPNAGNVLLAQLSVWDTEKDAREFFDAYAKRTKLRYPNATPTNPAPNSRSLYPQSSWGTSEGGVVIELRGKRVLVMEGVPDGINAGILAKALWQ
jgi:hypothetical protein